MVRSMLPENSKELFMPVGHPRWEDEGEDALRVRHTRLLPDKFHLLDVCRFLQRNSVRLRAMRSHIPLLKISALRGAPTR
jgi:hypothetical protein